jgi:hypothetical protein
MGAASWLLLSSEVADTLLISINSSLPVEGGLMVWRVGIAALETKE